MYVCKRVMMFSVLLLRIGRSGRYGRKGVAINFVKNDDIRILRDIEQYYSTQIDEMPMNGMLVLVRTRDGDRNPVLSRTRFHFFQNPKINNVRAYRNHYRVSSFIFPPVGCNVIVCPSSRVTAFKSNQSNHCSMSTNVFE